MSCSQQPGPQVFLRGVRDVLGVEVSQRQWHAMRELERARVLESQIAEVRDLYGGQWSEDEILAEAMESTDDQMGKSRMSPIVVESVTNDFANMLAVESGERPSAERREVVRRMFRESAEVGVTNGTGRVVRFMTERGVRAALADADDFIRGDVGS